MQSYYLTYELAFCDLAGKIHIATIFSQTITIEVSMGIYPDYKPFAVHGEYIYPQDQQLQKKIQKYQILKNFSKVHLDTLFNDPQSLTYTFYSCLKNEQGQYIKRSNKIFFDVDNLIGEQWNFPDEEKVEKWKFRNATEQFLQSVQEYIKMPRLLDCYKLHFRGKSADFISLFSSECYHKINDIFPLCLIEKFTKKSPHDSKIPSFFSLSLQSICIAENFNTVYQKQVFRLLKSISTPLTELHIEKLAEFLEIDKELAIDLLDYRAYAPQLEFVKLIDNINLQQAFGHTTMQKTHFDMILKDLRCLFI